MLCYGVEEFCVEEFCLLRNGMDEFCMLCLMWRSSVCCYVVLNSCSC
jgi:hypothetical protein